MEKSDWMIDCWLIDRFIYKINKNVTSEMLPSRKRHTLSQYILYSRIYIVMLRSDTPERLWQRGKGVSGYSIRRIMPQGKTYTEVDGPVKRRHETNQDTSRVGFRHTHWEREMIQRDAKRQLYPRNDGKARKVRINCNPYFLLTRILCFYFRNMYFIQNEANATA